MADTTASTSNTFVLIYSRIVSLFTWIGEKLHLKAFSLDDYKERLHKHIKDAFKDEIKLPHPCQYQKRDCREGSACPLLGLPENACIHFIRGKCKFSDTPDKCKYRHYEKYADIYRKAKQEFRSRELQPYPMIKNILKRFGPVTIPVGLFLWNNLQKRLFDHVMKKIFS